MIVIGDDEIEKLTLKEKLAIQFKMKELGKLIYFLKIEVAYPKQGILISEMKHVLDLLKETRKLGCKTSKVPIEQNHRIDCEESPTIEKSDIAYVVSVVKQFMYDPRKRYLQAVERILQYLKVSPGKRLLFRKEDANYAGSVVDRRSTFGYCMFLGGNLVTWRTISIAHNPIQHDKTKNIEIDKYFIKEKLNSGLVVTAHIATRLQVVDVFTKGLPAARFQELNDKLGMIDIHLLT
ncbi:Copia protein, partial [Mucuna pruriens]